MPPARSKASGKAPHGAASERVRPQVLKSLPKRGVPVVAPRSRRSRGWQEAESWPRPEAQLAGRSSRPRTPDGILRPASRISATGTLRRTGPDRPPGGDPPAHPSEAGRTGSGGRSRKPEDQNVGRRHPDPRGCRLQSVPHRKAQKDSPQGHPITPWIRSWILISCSLQRRLPRARALSQFQVDQHAVVRLRRHAGPPPPVFSVATVNVNPFTRTSV